MSHDSHGHAPDHAHEAGGKMVIFSLFLFFVITAAGHYVFVVQAHGPSSETARILGEHQNNNAETKIEKEHKPEKH